jgi:hypothetical protein
VLTLITSPMPQPPPICHQSLLLCRSSVEEVDTKKDWRLTLSPHCCSGGHSAYLGHLAHSLFVVTLNLFVSHLWSHGTMQSLFLYKNTNIK